MKTALSTPNKIVECAKIVYNGTNRIQVLEDKDDMRNYASGKESGQPEGMVGPGREADAVACKAEASRPACRHEISFASTRRHGTSHE